MKKQLLSGAIALCAALSSPLMTKAGVQEYVFSYDYDGATYDYFGIQRNVRYDAAMLLKEASLVGSEIVGISVDIPYIKDCECDPTVAGWLTTRLGVEDDMYTFDLQRAYGEIRNYGTEEEPELRVDITFDEPYTVTAEGVYVGYSVKVLNCKTVNGWKSKYPVKTVCDVDKPESLMVRCAEDDSTLPKRYPDWTNLNATTRQALAIRVKVHGEVATASASIEPAQTLYLAPGTTGSVYTLLTNHSTDEISSIEYSYLVGDRKVSKEFRVDPPLTGQVGASVTLDLPFEAPEETGEYSVSVSLDKINGTANGHIDPATLSMEVVPFLPVHSPLVEDYTGFWCGYCPAVYVNVKQMQAKYGEEFLSLSYHSLDQLQTVPTGSMPSSTYGLPKVYMEDRETPVSYDDMEYLWLRKRRELAPADMKVKLTWSDATKTNLRADAEVKFVYDESEADYRLSFVMVEDGMSDSSWGQENQYFNQNIEGPYWDLFCGKGYIVTGLVYDDVVVSSPASLGIPESLPAEIEGGRTYHRNGVLSLADATCRYSMAANYGKSVIKDRDKLRIVALLIDAKTGFVRNAVTTGYSKDAPVYDPNTDGVADISSDADAQVRYFTLQGVPVSAPAPGGLYIRVEGTRSSKIIL